jgi:hypothetical protein
MSEMMISLVGIWVLVTAVWTLVLFIAAYMTEEPDDVIGSFCRRAIARPRVIISMIVLWPIGLVWFAVWLLYRFCVSIWANDWSGKRKWYQ